MYQSADDVFREYENGAMDLDAEGYPDEELAQVRRLYENEYLLLAPISGDVHQQVGPVCYSFSVASMLRATLKRLGREGQIRSHTDVVKKIQSAFQEGALNMSHGATVGALHWVVATYPGLAMREVEDHSDAERILQMGERCLAMSFALSHMEWSAFSKFYRDADTRSTTLTRATLDDMVAAGAGAAWGEGSGGRHSVVAAGFERGNVTFKNSWGDHLGMRGIFHIEYRAMTHVKFWDLIGKDEE